MSSLTASEALARAAAMRVLSYHLELDLDRGPDHFGSQSQIACEVMQATDTFLDVTPHRLHAVELDGVTLDPTDLADGRFPLHLDAGEHRLLVSADMAYRNDGEGLHRSVDPADDTTYIYAMSFLDAAPSIFGCFDQPDLKAPYSMRVTAPPEWTVLGNTRASQVSPGRWELAESAPLATYFVTLVAGPYHCLTREHDGIRMGLVAVRSLAEHLDKDADELFGVTAAAFDEYHRLFGIRYPFGDYYQAFVPEFNAGAMENPGCVTFRDEMIFRSQVPDGVRSGRARVIVHEMAHQWFGDLVTMRWWDDLWLNESFAEYMAYRVTDDVTAFRDSWVEFAYGRKRWGMAADQRPSTHPVAGNGAPDAAAALTDFDGISYAKGAAALKQLNAYLGDEVFLAGVRTHLRDHAYGNATLDDLFGAWERAGAEDLRAWSMGWLRTPGLDTLRVGEGQLTRIPPADHPAQRPHGLTVRRVDADNDGRDERLQVVGDATALPWGPEAGTLLIPDARDETWAKVRYDEHTLAALPDRIAEVTDPVTRGAIWLAVRDAVADGDLSCELVLDLLVAGLPAETEDIAVSNLSWWADVFLVGQYLGGDTAASGRVAAALDRRLYTAAPGSGLQLAAALGVAEVSTDSPRLRRWLDGDPPEGLAMDADMRWLTLTQLARRGGASRDDIDAELARDTSSQGVVHAARARASLPDVDTKAAVWTRILTDHELSNAQAYALCEGFWRAEQSELLQPYVARYFAEIASTASFRSGWLVAETAQLLFPSYAAEPATLDLADALLADESLDPGLRRSVSDSRDDLRRAVAIRAG
ncbi:MAG: aminopeptidase N [Nocardioidaceae bacterium]|nr:aminopeptidase N [Nocardioidaceae bacterium]